MNDTIGAMRHRVTLQRPTRVADEIGGAAIAWTDDGQCWAAIEASGANEAPAFDAARVLAATRVSIRRRDDVRAGWRVIWGQRCLRIVGVSDDGGSILVLSCEEETL